MQIKDIGYAFLFISILFITGSFLGYFSGASFTGFLESLWITGTTSTGLESIIPITAIMICTGMAALVPFSCGVANIGGEGQLQIGAITGLYVALVTQSIILSLIAALLGGMVYAFIPGILKARYDINEIMTTLIFNLISIQIMSYIAASVLNDPTATVNMTVKNPLSLSSIPLLGIILGVAIVSYLLMEKTVFGYNIKLTGRNPEVGRYCGLPIIRISVLSMLIGGAFAGLAGGILASTLASRLQVGVTSSYGYIGLIASLLVKNRARYILMSAIFIGYFLVAARVFHIFSNVPFAISNVLFGLLFFILLIIRRR